jgi:predicted small metal-binding protein
MAKVYVISCREAGVDCDFVAEGATMEDVMEKCAQHAIAQHGMKGFGPELYAKMRRCVQAREE